ncbi:Pollen Ole e 1 allergen/extensin [Spatholobus suberectus]|nr:Pollen Ole e 1 allergen/extensin [Spatholobus suberectus]
MEKQKTVMGLILLLLSFALGVSAWTGEIHGRVVCDVCGDSSLGPEDHVLEGAEVAVLCITKSGEVLNYQAFTDAKGIYTVAETMPESDRWDACLARPISSFHEQCTQLGEGSLGLNSVTITHQDIHTLSGPLFIDPPVFQLTAFDIYTGLF